MTPPHSNWLQLLDFWRQTQDSTRLSDRVTRLEVHRERQDDINQQTESRMAWLERGLQALAILVLALLTKQAPSSAGAVADLLLAMLKR